MRVQFLGHGGDDALGESAHRVAEQAVLVREVQVHSLHDTGRIRCAAWTTALSRATPTRSCATGSLIGPGDVLAVHPEPIQRELAVCSPRRATAPVRATWMCSRPIRASRAPARCRGGARSTGAPPGRTRACASCVAGGHRHRLDRRQRGSARPRRRAAGARRAPSDRPRGPAALPARRGQGRCALRRGGVADPGVGRPGLPGARWGGRRRAARRRPPALRAPRVRRPRGRLAPARSTRRARRTADRARPARDPATAPGTDLRLALPAGEELARRHQRRARAPPHAQHPHRRGLHQPTQSATSGQFRCTRPLALADA